MLTAPQIVQSQQANQAMIGSHLKALADTKGPLRILEAGCGRAWAFRDLHLDMTLVGVDLDAQAMEARKNIERDLDETIVGDLRTVSLPADSFDVIYCSYVLEHVRSVSTVLANFARWLRKDGLLIVLVPDGRSVFGLLTRATPHWFHIFVYRYVWGYRLAGTPGHGPYPTYYERPISAPGLLEFAKTANFEVVELRGSINMTAARFRRLFKVIQFLTLGYSRADHSDLVVILRKR